MSTKDGQSFDKGSSEVVISAEEQRLRRSYLRKADWHLLPPAFAMYFYAVVDRNNIGNARVAGMDVELGLHGNQFNWVASAFFFTYIFFEIPSNIML
ncbi:hypothetical protein IWW57_006687, partial [Coemansia sp. S610]